MLLVAGVVQQGMHLLERPVGDPVEEVARSPGRYAPLEQLHELVLVVSALKTVEQLSLVAPSGEGEQLGESAGIPHLTAELRVNLPAALRLRLLDLVGLLAPPVPASRP